MLRQVKPDSLSSFFTPLSGRSSRGVYLVRFAGYSGEVHAFVRQFYEQAGKNGVILENGLQNPDSSNLAYFTEQMGTAFQLSQSFLDASLRKWLPRLSTGQRSTLAGAMLAVLQDLKRSGKNDNMLKNCYIKFMCWLYYKFERIIPALGGDRLPKILYGGTPGVYQLLLLQLLCGAGCDAVILEYRGDGDYRKADPEGKRSDLWPVTDPWPADFSLKQIRQEIQEEYNIQQLYGPKPSLTACTSAWLTGDVLQDLRKEPSARGSDPNLFYNSLIRLTGVEDRDTYANDLYRLQLELKNAGRKLVIVSGSIEMPSPQEIAGITRHNVRTVEQMITDLSANLKASQPELQKLMHTAFVDLMLEESRKPGSSVGRLTSRAVTLLCWLKRYQPQLFPRWTPPDVSAFFYLGGCRGENEVLFLRFLSRLPVDVVIFAPDLSRKCELEDSRLFEKKGEFSQQLTVYPTESSGIRVSTVARNAERELDTLMYTDSGMYRSQQYGKADVITLQTMYEEIAIYWDQELKYRPSFGTVEGTVSVPVIYSKVSGVKDGNTAAYWQSIRSLLTPDTRLISQVPHIQPNAYNPLRGAAPEFFRNGRLQKQKILNHPNYPYGILRESMQEHLLDKIQLLIDQKTIRGTFENGTEYTIVSTCLNLEQDLVRMVQKFDFTKKNPKLVYVITSETTLSLEDTITAAYLNLVGFDIVFFVPTGYQCIEHHYRTNLPEEHQIGEYIYDLTVPDFSRLAAPRLTWRERLFGKGS